VRACSRSTERSQQRDRVLEREPLEAVAARREEAESRTRQTGYGEQLRMEKAVFFRLWKEALREYDALQGID